MPGDSHEWKQQKTIYLNLYRMCPMKMADGTTNTWQLVCDLKVDNPSIGKPGIGLLCFDEANKHNHEEWQSISENQGQDVADDINHTHIHFHRDPDDGYKTFHIYINRLLGAGHLKDRVSTPWDRYCNAGDYD